MKMVTGQFVEKIDGQEVISRYAYVADPTTLSGPALIADANRREAELKRIRSRANPSAAQVAGAAMPGAVLLSVESPAPAAGSTRRAA
jgi:hypothetical protein